MGLFHATGLELPHQTCYLRQAWTARKFSLTWKGVLCRELVQLSMKETNVSSCTVSSDEDETVKDWNIPLSLETAVEVQDNRQETSRK